MVRENPVTAVRSYKKQKHRTSKKPAKEKAVLPILFPMPVEKLRRYMGAYEHVERNESDGLWNDYDDYESFSKAYDDALKQENTENNKDVRTGKETIHRTRAANGKNKSLKTRKKKPVAMMKGNVHKKSIYFENLAKNTSQKENLKASTERNKCKKSNKTNTSRKNGSKVDGGIANRIHGKESKQSARQYEGQIRHSRTQYDWMKKNLTKEEPIMELKLDPSYECLPPKYVEKLHEMRIRYEIKSRAPRRTIIFQNDKLIPVGTKAVTERTKGKEQFKRMSFSAAQLDRIKDMKMKYNEIKYRDPQLENIPKLPPSVEGKRQHVDSWIVRHKSLPSLTFQSLPSTSL